MRKIEKKFCMKRLISVALLISTISALILNTYAVSNEEISAISPPPELIILDGEEWIPDAVDPFAITMYGSEDECKHGGGKPENYRYIGAVRGSTSADTIAVNLFTDIISLFLPKPFNIALTFIGFAENIVPNDQLEGEYIKHQFIYNFGPDPNMYWYHYHFEFATKNGKPVGDACYATYSPKKPGDPYQD